MAAIAKGDSRLKLQFVVNSDHCIHAGIVAIEAMAWRFDLRNKLHKLPCLDTRKDRKRGFGPEVVVGQVIYALCSGGGCLSNSEALNDDPLAREVFGVKKFADQTQVGQWLREQSEESVAALRQLLHQFAGWVWQKAEPRRLLHAGRREVFFDDNQLEVSGKKFEGLRSITTADVSDQLLPMLGRHRSLWQGVAAHFYADSGSSAGVYLNAIAAKGWHYTVSYNKWTGPLERTAQALPALAWQQRGESHHALLLHQPEGVTRRSCMRRAGGGMDCLTVTASSRATMPRPTQPWWANGII